MKKVWVILMLISFVFLTGCQFYHQAEKNFRKRLGLQDLVDDNYELNIFEDSSEWSVIFGEIKDDNVYIKNGTQSIWQNLSDEGIADAQREVDIFFGYAPRVRLTVYIHESPIRIAILFSSKINPNSHFIARVGYDDRALQRGWNIIDIYPEQWERNAGEDWANTMKVFRIRIESGKEQVTSPVTWDQIVINMSGIPGVMITFDDGFASTYTEAFLYMKQINARGTAYVITDRIDQSSRYLSIDQLKEMNSHGWSIANHSHTHEKPLIAYDQVNITTQLLVARESLDAWGLNRASSHLAYPWGNWNTEVLDVMEALNMKTGRMVNHVNHVIWASTGVNYFIGTRLVDPFHTVEDVKYWIDQAIEQERIVGLCFHELVFSNKGNIQWLVDDFYEIIDYIHENNIPFITINDYYAIARTNVLVIDDYYQIKMNNKLVVGAPGLVENDYFLSSVDYKVVLDSYDNKDNDVFEVFEDGSFNYLPTKDWTGKFEFHYRVCVENYCTETAKVTINVIND